MTLYCQGVREYTACYGHIVGCWIHKRCKKTTKTAGVGQKPEIHQGVSAICSHLVENKEAVPEVRKHVGNENILGGKYERVCHHSGGNDIEFCHEELWWKEELVV